MDDKNLNRRELLGGIALAAGTAGLLGATDARAAAPSLEGPPPDMGPSQKPPITDVAGKIAYITGGSSGIGLGIARALHEQGAKVILGNLNDKQWAEALKEFPANDPRVKTIVHDVSDRDAWERKADEIEKFFGPVNILINNAGVGLFTSAREGTLKDWDWGMNVNFWGPVYGCRTFIPRMLKHGQGSHIVTTTSTDGVLLGTAGIYAVSKMAVSGLMEQLRHELRETTIGTSNLVPGQTTSNLGRSESEYRPEALKNAPNRRGRRATGRRRCAPSRASAHPRDHTAVGASAIRSDGRPPGGQRHRQQRHVDLPGARVRRRRPRAGRGDGRKHGAVQPDARPHRGRQGPLLPHAHLRAGNRASPRDEETRHQGRLTRRECLRRCATAHRRSRSGARLRREIAEQASHQRRGPQCGQHQRTTQRDVHHPVEPDSFCEPKQSGKQCSRAER